MRISTTATAAASRAPACRAGPSNEPALKLAKLHHTLQRLGGAKGTAPAAAATTAPPSAPAARQWVTPEERAVLTPDQWSFLERKRKAAAGLGPVFPESSCCPTCGGGGQVVCGQCGGSGINSVDKAAELFNGPEEGKGVVKQNNGLHDVKWYFMQNAPCWLCRGNLQVGCRDCGGSGIEGLANKYVAD